MKRFLERLLNLQRGDLGRGFLLFSGLFLILATYITGQTVRDALFLSKFGALKLPYVDIALAMLVGFVVAGYVRLSRHFSLRTLLCGSQLFFAANALLFWLLIHVKWPWACPVIYVWVGIFGVLAPAQLWTLANYVLTTREAKRLYGLVGAGAISGALFASLFSRSMTKAFGVESLLLGMTLFLILCAGVAVFISPRQAAAGAHPGELGQSTGSESLHRSMRLVWSSPYLMAIAAAILMSSWVAALAGWQFKALAAQTFHDKNTLGIFIANFSLYTSVLCLCAQLFLTSRVLRRFGIGPALFVVPVALLAGSAGLLAWGTLAAAAVLRGSDKVLKYSIDKSTMELLYLPVPSRVKVQAKSFIDTVIWRLGDGFSGLTVLLLATTYHWTARRLGWVNILLVLGSMTAVVVARRQYVATLKESIRQHRLDIERVSAPVLDRSTTDIFAAHLSSADANELIYALGLFEMGQHGATHPAVRVLLNHSSPEVRKKAISISAAAGDASVRPLIEKLLRDPHIEVRTEALLYLARHAQIDPLARLHELGNFPDFSVRAGVIWYLAQPGPTQSPEAVRLMLDSMVKESGPEGQRTRVEAGRLIGELSGELTDDFDEHLRILLADPDTEVVRRAIRAVGNLGKRQFVPRLLNRITDPQLAPDVVEALAKSGDRIVGTLRDHLSDDAASIQVRREIPAVLARIGTEAAAQALAESVLQSDTALRLRVISSLNKLHQAHPEIAVDKQMIETLLAVEIMGHYRTYQILGALGSSPESQEARARLCETMNQEVERVFRLLSLLFPHHDFHSAYVGLQSKDLVVHDNALELLDNILKPQLRNVLVPLLDGAISVAARVRLADRLVGAKMDSREEAVEAMVASNDVWLKSCGLHAIGSLGLKKLEPCLERCLEDTDPELREAAGQAKARLAAVAKAAAASDQ